MTKSPIINPATNRRAAFVTAAFRSLADIVVAHCAKDKLARPQVTQEPVSRLKHRCFFPVNQLVSGS